MRKWISLLQDKEDKLTVYTTRPDTLFGVTYMVMSPEHPFIDKYKDSIKNWDDVVAYREMAAKKSDFERTEIAKDKTGVMLDGLTAVNPVNGKEIPVWISDYVLMTYGTGAIMAVPAHDDKRLGICQEIQHAHHRSSGRQPRGRKRSGIYRRVQPEPL